MARGFIAGQPLTKKMMTLDEYYKEVFKYFCRIDWSIPYPLVNAGSIQHAKETAMSNVPAQLAYMKEEHGSDINNPFVFEVDFGPGEWMREGFVGIWLNPVADKVRDLPRNKTGNIIWPKDLKIFVNSKIA